MSEKRIFKCTNPDCKYGENGKKLDAYDQDSLRWQQGHPAYFGLCLNCLDDWKRDSEMEP